SKVVPTPDCRPEVKRMATASCIQSTWEPTSSTTRHTSAGVASITVLTRMELTGACYEQSMTTDGSSPQVADGTDPDADGHDLLALAGALADAGRAVRDAVRAGRVGRDHDVVRTEGGDDVFGVDDRADQVLLAELA